MANGPWLSVIIPTYNGERFVGAALRSIALQQDDGVEVVVIDDGSTDSTLRVVEEFVASLRLKVIANAHSGNWVRSTNVGLETALGRFATFLHQDDIWLPQRLDLDRSRALAASADVLLISATQFVSAGGHRLGSWHCPLPVGWVQSEKFVERLLVQNSIGIPAPIFSRKAALSVGGLDEALWYTADWDFWLKLSASCAIHYDPAARVGFRVHGASQTIRRSSAADQMRAQQVAVLERYESRVPERRRGRVRRIACASIDVNTALALTSSGTLSGWPRALGTVMGLGPGDAIRYVRHSRITERMIARIRARLADSWHHNNGGR
jgi:GT2 family glycosyltransferase